MKILIVEDEKPILTYIIDCLKEIISANDQLITSQRLSDAVYLMQEHEFDLCFLDLNIHGENGFDLLKNFLSKSFQTIIISAYADKAVEAFQYGVLDFIEKPFDRSRLKLALDRFHNKEFNRNELKFLSYREMDSYQLLQLDKILYFKADGPYSIAFLEKAKCHINKSMDQLTRILPDHFFQSHRSYIVNLQKLENYMHAGSGVYQIIMQTNIILPLSRANYKRLKEDTGYNN